jgi:hypothetical protein
MPGGVGAEAGGTEAGGTEATGGEAHRWVSASGHSGDRIGGHTGGSTGDPMPTRGSRSTRAENGDPCVQGHSCAGKWEGFPQL